MYTWASANSLPLQNIIVGQCVYVRLQCDVNLKGATREIYSEFFFSFFRKEAPLTAHEPVWESPRAP